MTEVQISFQNKSVRHARIFQGINLEGVSDKYLEKLIKAKGIDVNQPSGLTPINPMLQLFSVCVDLKDGNKPAKMYGQVDVKNGSGVFRFFECKPEDALPICHNTGLLPLTDPPSSYHGISAADSLVEISVELYVLIEGEDKKDTVVREICNSSITWDKDNNSNRYYHSCISEGLVGEYGSAWINYIVVRCAVEATIEVSFVDDDDDGPRGRNVFGEILAYYGKFRYNCIPDVEDFYKFTLFDDSFLRTGKLPLRRSVLAIPGSSSLVIEAKLCDDDSEEKYIFNACHRFPVEYDNDSSSGHIEGEIPGCRLVLKVDWQIKPFIDDTV